MGKTLIFFVASFFMFVATGCAVVGPPPGLRAAVPAVEEPPKLSPEQEAEKADARQAYVSCLKQAAHYANEKAVLANDAAALIAPMCYPQFSRFEAAATAGMEGRALHTFDRNGDRRQLEFAADAIRQEQGLASLSTNQ